MALSTLAPGFRFHPTDAELVMYYLKRKLSGKKIIVDAIAEVNIYDFDPRELPDKSSLRSRDLEWFFFCPKARKYSCGPRANRATETGFWKATGKDRKVKYQERTVAVIKTLVFHRRHAANVQRTDWVMHEYRMEDEHLANAGIVQDTYVLCKIFEKSGAGPQNGAQYGAPFNEEEWDDEGHEATNPLDFKQKGPAAKSLSITEPGSSTVTFSSNGTTNTLNDKQKGPATMNMTLDQRACSLSVTEPGSSLVTSPLSHKRKGSATMNVTVNQSLYGVSLNEAGSSSFTFSANERHVDMPVNDDVMLLGDVATIMGVSAEDLNGNDRNEGKGKKLKSVASNEDEGIYDDLTNLVSLEDLDDGAEYLDRILTSDVLDANLREFTVD